MEKSWEILERVLQASIREQRTARRWKNFFQLSTLGLVVAAYVAGGPSLSEMWGDKSQGITAKVSISGTIAEGERAGASVISRGLEAAFKDPRTKAVILDINSPGGSPVQAGRVYDEIKRERSLHPNIKVYAVIGDLGASGAYYIASAADEIYADKASLVGSIGVTAASFGYVDLMKKLGVERRAYTSGEHKAFLDQFQPENPAETAFWQGVLQQILRRVGLPVGVGIGPTKTLAKIANWAAKRWKARTGCVVDLRDRNRQEKLLQYAPVGEVWGIGPRLSKRLAEELQVKTAWQLANTDPKHLRRHFNVNVERTARELLGMSCFPFLDSGPVRKQMIISSRSFGEKVYALEDLQAAVAGFVGIAAEKLRAQGSFANCLQVFARTSPFSAGDQYSGTRILAMPYPADDTRDLLRAALSGLEALYRPGYAYAKAGVVLSQFAERGAITGDLFAPKPRPNSQRLMAVMDAINIKQGRGAIRLGRQQPVGCWSMKRELLTPAYTTSWRGLAKADCQAPSH